MRILLLHDYGTLNGGAEVMIVNLRDALRTRGHQALLFTSTARPLALPIVADETCFGTVSPLRRGLQAFNPHALFSIAAGTENIPARCGICQNVSDPAFTADIAAFA